MSKQRAGRLNPYDGVPGFWGRLNRIVYTFAGPAQVGIGRPEEAATPVADPRCPMCGQPMADHVITRGDATRPTHLRCPVPPAAPSGPGHES